jgi:release factor glutamine methyltransferase
MSRIRGRGPVIIRPVPTVGDVVRDAERRLKASEAIDHPHRGREREDVLELMEYALGRKPSLREELSGARLLRVKRLVARREAGWPVAYLTGRSTFGGLELEVRRGAFIPRESSEFMAQQALRRLRRRPRPVHVDLATGIGPVALAVASALGRARVFGVDVSPKPLALARRNARRLRLSNVVFLRGDLYDPLPRTLLGAVDVVTIHPPYVGRGEVRELPEEILRFEPPESLTDFSPRGDRIVRRVVKEAPAWLRPGGWLLIEVSPDRSRRVAAILRRAGLQDVRSTIGPVPVSRVVVGRR